MSKTKAQPTDSVMRYALRLGDDALVLGQRLSEWVGNAPFLEEDIALSNVALDFIGRARMFYAYAAELAGNDKTEDDFAFYRDQREFCNYLICELPRGNFADTIGRQLVLDVYYCHFFTALSRSADHSLAAIAAKALKESQYHLRRSRRWALCLGDGTDESRARMQAALDGLWGYTDELFEHDELELELIEAGIAVSTSMFRGAWQDELAATIEQATLALPQVAWRAEGGRAGMHTEELGHLLNEMQSMRRTYPRQWQW